MPVSYNSAQSLPDNTQSITIASDKARPSRAYYLDSGQVLLADVSLSEQLHQSHGGLVGPGQDQHSRGQAV